MKKLVALKGIKKGKKQFIDGTLGLENLLEI